MVFLLTVLAFIFVIGVLVLVHEVGHFLFAKLVGIRVEEFGIGLPPRLWYRRRGETVYSLNALPFGGFVKLTGEDEVDSDDPAAFIAKPGWQRFLVLSAGVLMNLLLAVVIFTLIFSFGVPVADRVTIEEVTPNAPAAEVGLTAGDIILRLDGEEVSDGLMLIGKILKKAGQQVSLTVLRQEGELTFELTPRREYPQDQGPMGVAIKTHFVKKTYPLWQAPWVGMREALGLTLAIGQGLVEMVSNFVTKGEIPKDVTGPVGIFQLTGEAAQTGWLALLQLLGLLSLNLGIVNILPIPALDGGRLVFVLVEIITGHRPRARVEHWIHSVGFAILIVLVVLVTIKDLSQIQSVYQFFLHLKAFTPGQK